MKYTDFEHGLKRILPVFSKRDLEKMNLKVFDWQLSSWQKKGYLKRICNNFYQFSEQEIPKEKIANTIYQPSYVSLESALYYYNLTEDVVFQITSVTTKKTREILSGKDIYIYQKIKARAFTGYHTIKIENFDILIACPEKALTDFFYLNQKKIKTKNGFLELRFNEDEIKKFDWKLCFAFASLFDSHNLIQLLRDYREYICSL